MLTQCPHCLTLFRVGPEHLKAAAGRVRCCRCHQVFNALESLREAPAPFVNASDEDSAERPLPPEDHATPTEPIESLQHDSEISLDGNTPPPERPIDEFQPLLPDLEPDQEVAEVAVPQGMLVDILERDDGLEPEPDYYAAGSESQMSELLDRDTSSILLPDSKPLEETPRDENDRETSETGNNVIELTPPPSPSESEESAGESELEEQDFEDSILKDEAIDEELGRPGYDAVPGLRPESEDHAGPEDGNERALNFEVEEEATRSGIRHPFWLAGSLLLLLLLGAQVGWQFRDDLIRFEAGRQAIGLVCRVTGCVTPQRRDLDRILIQGRNLTTHPDNSDALLLQLSLINTAAFSQPFPTLTLSLFNDEGSLIARRTFAVSDYLPADYAGQGMMPQAQPVLVELELIDPGNEVTGFSFDFH